MRLTAIVAGIFMFAIFFAGNNLTAKAQAPSPTENSQKIVEIKQGDTLTKIANQNATTYQRLFDANTNIADPDVVHSGDKIRIPSPDEVIASRAIAKAPEPSPARQPVKQKKAVTPKTAKPKPAPAASNPAGGGVWDRLAQCEAGGNWSTNTGNGYYGGLQFSLSSWRGVGGSGLPSDASKSEQISRGEMLKARQGWGAWPSCSAKLGLR